MDKEPSYAFKINYE